MAKNCDRLNVCRFLKQLKQKNALSDIEQKHGLLMNVSSALLPEILLGENSC